MLHMLKIADYLKILTDEEVEDVVIINFGDCFKCMGEASHSNFFEENILEKLLNCFILF